MSDILKSFLENVRVKTKHVENYPGQNWYQSRVSPNMQWFGDKLDSDHCTKDEALINLVDDSLK